jgi:hypothetical protein
VTGIPFAIPFALCENYHCLFHFDHLNWRRCQMIISFSFFAIKLFAIFQRFPNMILIAILLNDLSSISITETAYSLLIYQAISFDLTMGR